MTPDGIGSPRRPEVAARDEMVLDAIRELGKESGARVAAIRTACALERDALVHSLNRLRLAGKVERRDGYRWWTTD